MKNTLFVLALLCSVASAMGQISKGNIFLSGSGQITQERSTRIDGSGTDFSYPNTFTARLALSGAYFLTERIAVGIGGSIFKRKTEYNETETIERIRFGAGLFGRYYVPLSERFYFYGQAGFNYQGGGFTMIGITDPTNPKVTKVGFSVKPGFTFFPGGRFGIDIQFGRFGMVREKITNTSGILAGLETVRNEVNLRFDSGTLVFGLQYFLLR